MRSQCAKFKRLRMLLDRLRYDSEPSLPPRFVTIWLHYDLAIAHSRKHYHLNSPLNFILEWTLTHQRYTIILRSVRADWHLGLRCSPLAKMSSSILSSTTIRPHCTKNSNLPRTSFSNSCSYFCDLYARVATQSGSCGLVYVK